MMQDQELRTWDDGLDRPGTVGELIEFLRDVDPDLPVLFSYDGGWASRSLNSADDIIVTTEKGKQWLTFCYP